MGFKHILAPLFGYDGDQPTLEAALTLARPGGGHIAAFHAKADPLETTPLMVDVGVAIGELVEAAERHSETRSRRATEAFDRWRSKHNLPVQEQPTGKMGASGITTAYRSEKGNESELVIHYGRLTDLVVIAKPKGEEAADLISIRLEDAIFGAGRPVLVIPAEIPHNKLEHVVTGTALIAWNGTIEATHAIRAAFPLLRGMKAVHVLSIKEHKRHSHAAAELVSYLSWQGIAAEIANGPSKASGSTAENILSVAHDLHTDVLIMGGYSHGRLRQLVLGGVTDHMLEAADLPVLMAH